MNFITIFKINIHSHYLYILISKLIKLIDQLIYLYNLSFVYNASNISIPVALLTPDTDALPLNVALTEIVWLVKLFN